MENFVCNAWYVLGWSTEIGSGLLARRILNEPVVAFRKRDGQAVALLDRCAHRLVPLSMGKVVNDTLQCGYHGMQYDCTGACVHVPGQTRIPSSAQVRSFPTEERYGAVWIWMGDPALADPAKIIPVKRYGDDGWAVVWGAPQYHRSNYLNIVENLQDPAHTTYVHPSTIGNPASSEVPTTIEESDDHIAASRWTLNAEPPPVDKSNGNFEGLTDRCQRYNFYPPCVSRVDVVTMDAGQEHTEENMDGGLRAFSYKFLTPETDKTTHFFWMHVRNFGVGDKDLEARLVPAMAATFEEDNVIVTAMQREQDAAGVRQYTWLAIDAGPTRARRMIEKLAADEENHRADVSAARSTAQSQAVSS